MVENNPKSADAYRRRGEQRLEGGKVDDAVKDAQKAIELEPDNVPAIFLAAQCALAKKDVGKAREHASKIVKLAPKNPIGYLLLGQIEMLAAAVTPLVALFGGTGRAA